MKKLYFGNQELLPDDYVDVYRAGFGVIRSVTTANTKKYVVEMLDGEQQGEHKICPAMNLTRRLRAHEHEISH